MSVDEQEVLRRAREAVGPCPPNSFQYGAHEMMLEKAKDTARREIEAEQRRVIAWHPAFLRHMSQ